MKAIGNSEHKFLLYVIGISRLTVLSHEIKLVNIYLDIFTISKFMVYKQQKKKYSDYVLILPLRPFHIPVTASEIVQ